MSVCVCVCVAGGKIYVFRHIGPQTKGATCMLFSFFIKKYILLFLFLLYFTIFAASEKVDSIFAMLHFTDRC